MTNLIFLFNISREISEKNSQHIFFNTQDLEIQSLNFQKKEKQELILALSGQISAKICLNISRLKNRNFNLVSYQRSKHAQKAQNFNIRLQCQNPYGDWNLTCKVISFLSSNEEEFLPFTQDQISQILRVFRGSNISILSLEALYSFTFMPGDTKENNRT